MLINTDSLISITEANQNFSKVARLADETGAAVILKNNSPKYVLLEFSQLQQLSELPVDSTQPGPSVVEIGKKILARNHRAFEELAK